MTLLFGVNIARRPFSAKQVFILSVRSYCVLESSGATKVCFKTTYLDRNVQRVMFTIKLDAKLFQVLLKA